MRSIEVTGGPLPGRGAGIADTVATANQCVPGTSPNRNRTGADLSGADAIGSVDQLIAAFRRTWSAPLTDRLAAAPAVPRRSGLERLVHPEAGELRLSYESLDAGGQRLVVYLPADEGTAAALDRLTLCGPVPLRAVSG
ncbi:hypothetical protein [Nocardiopsis sp. CA-288880]|uniref:MmyB family transcriptional regulator n=1 Tax=Nocardiopsis sp. CA-288880 TaxID=3239995 RepID=UPI003D973986